VAKGDKTLPTHKELGSCAGRLAWWNIHRLPTAIGDVPPAESEETYYAKSRATEVA
jgi:hypothetical protein